MHEDPKALLKQAIKACLPILQPLVDEFVTTYQVWKNVGSGQWRGETELRPDVRHAFHVVDDQIKESATAFGTSFVAHHQDHCGNVGFRSNSQNWAKNQGNIVRIALEALWHTHKTFDIGDAQVDAIVQEASDFVDSPTVRLRYQA